IDVMVFFKSGGTTNVVDVNPVFGERTLRFFIKPVIEEVDVGNVTLQRAVKLEVYWDKEGEPQLLGAVELPILRNATSTVTIPIDVDLFTGNVSPMEPGAYTAAVSVGFKLLVVPPNTQK
ncbi:MAG: hypothetical protein GXO07_00660, partial [Crenarchaeota archaeon]|nr:hypothetical protein [Thermoproteota archaeon]